MWNSCSSILLQALLSDIGHTHILKSRVKPLRCIMYTVTWLCTRYYLRFVCVVTVTWWLRQSLKRGACYWRVCLLDPPSSTSVLEVSISGRVLSIIAFGCLVLLAFFQSIAVARLKTLVGILAIGTLCNCPGPLFFNAASFVKRPIFSKDAILIRVGR